VVPAPELNLVQCVQQGTLCKGTDGNDLLVGTSAEENIQGGGGDDVYDGKNGEDLWFDRSATTNDTYLAGPALQASAQSGKFEPWTVLDSGGSDILDFGPFSSEDIVAVTEPFEGQLGIQILLQEDPRRTGFVSVLDHLRNEANKVERFKFADQTFTAQEMEALIQRV
jgi:Ca2+-binding RTX toxin-like protein